jgi:hypothetical protein
MAKRKTPDPKLFNGSSVEGPPSTPRQTEQDVFEELGRLCVSPGYVHALSFICFKDNIVGYAEEISGELLLKKYSWDRLIRTEVMTLLGLMLKSSVVFTLPEPATVQRYVEETYRLMSALHEAMSSPFFAQMTPEKVRDPAFNPFALGSGLREPIFYSGESAYTFQFRDLAALKYAEDNEWLNRHRGFPIETARGVVQAFTKVQNENLTNTLHGLRQKHPSEWSLVDGFSVNADDVAKSSGYTLDMVMKVLSAFALPEGERNDSFQSLHDFNVSTSTPLLRRGSDTFILFEQYSLAQALYDSPFYWMGADREYKDTAMSHRGQFAESFVRERLEVFSVGTEYSKE